MTPSAARPSPMGWFFSIENRYLGPLLITSILIFSQTTYGVLESLSRTALAIAASLVFEAGLGLLVRGRVPHLASAYISGISVGILIRSPEWWPYFVVSAIAITSKYVLRWRGRHLWNPSNFAIVAILLLAPENTAILSIQWGNNLWPMLVIWILGAAILYRVRRFHISLTYAISFLVLACVRSVVTGDPYLAEVAPITGPMYQLFIFFMVTDPRTTVATKKGQMIVAFLVALLEMVLRMAEVVNAPFFALAVVGPAALALELGRQPRENAEARS